MSEEKIFYRCDPEKNTRCKKRGCYMKKGPCRATDKEDCAVKNADGKPVEEFRVRGKADGTD